MKHLATTRGLTAALLLLALPFAAQAQDIRTHDTDAVQFDVYDNGFLGASASAGPNPGGGGFFFNGGPTSLYEGQLIVTNSETGVCGEAYAGQTGQEPYNWVNTAAFAEITEFNPPYEEFDEGYTVSFDCSGDSSTPLPVSVTETSYSREGDPYVVFQFDVLNESASALNGVYVAVFADFDVGDYTLNLADFDDATNLVYVWDGTGTDLNYYGVTALDGPVSGYTFDAGGGFNPTPASLYQAATNGGNEPPPTSGADRRILIAVGPYDLGAGEAQAVRFAFVAGEDIGPILANAADAIEAVQPTAIEPGPDGTPGTHALSAPAPNPANGRSAFTLEVAQTQNVRVAVYDALGREVATLHDGALAAGTEHRFALDTASLPSGVYLVRTVGERFTDTRTISVAR